jgi:hypothetical protein
MKIRRRSFMQLASGLLVPWERERVYSFAAPIFSRTVLVKLFSFSNVIAQPAYVAQVLATANDAVIGDIVGLLDDGTVSPSLRHGVSAPIGVVVGYA